MLIIKLINLIKNNNKKDIKLKISIKINKKNYANDYKNVKIKN
jgi:hypothetical protein